MAASGKFKINGSTNSVVETHSNVITIDFYDVIETAYISIIDDYTHAEYDIDYYDDAVYTNDVVYSSSVQYTLPSRYGIYTISVTFKDSNGIEGSKYTKKVRYTPVIDALDFTLTAASDGSGVTILPNVSLIPESSITVAGSTPDYWDMTFLPKELTGFARDLFYTISYKGIKIFNNKWEYIKTISNDLFYTGVCYDPIDNCIWTQGWNDLDPYRIRKWSIVNDGLDLVDTGIYFTADDCIGIATDGRYIYGMTREKYIYVWDKQGNLIKSIYTPNYTANSSYNEGIEVFNGYLYFASNNGYVHVLDITDINNPKFVTEYKIREGDLSKLCTDGYYLYASNTNETTIYRLQLLPKMLPYRSTSQNSGFVKVHNKNAKILVIDYNGTPGQYTYIANALQAQGYSVTFNNSVTTVNECLGYDIILAERYCWGISKGSLLNQLYQKGFKIISQGNDTTATIQLITGVASKDTSLDWSLTRKVINEVTGDLGATRTTGDKDSGYRITGIADGVEVWYEMVNYPGSPAIIYDQNAQGGKWLHIQPIYQNVCNVEFIMAAIDKMLGGVPVSSFFDSAAKDNSTPSVTASSTSHIQNVYSSDNTIDFSFSGNPGSGTTYYYYLVGYDAYSNRNLFAWEDAESRVIFIDSRYPSSWTSNITTTENYFTSRGFVAKNADDLKTWMQNKITNNTARGSICVLPKGMVPDTIAETMSSSCTIRQYLNAGGSVLWLGDVPFYYQGKNDGTYTIWDNSGASTIIGVGTQNWDNNSTAVITTEGSKWGMQTADIARRPVPRTDVTKILSEISGGGSACSWVKNFNLYVPLSGFIRYRAASYDGSNNAFNLDAYNLAVFSVQGKVANITVISPIDGYSYVVDTSATTIPDTTKETSGTTYTTFSLTDGSWYFHIRSINKVGAGSNTMHLGPYLIDVTNPIINNVELVPNPVDAGSTLLIKVSISD